MLGKFRVDVEAIRPRSAELFTQFRKFREFRVYAPNCLGIPTPGTLYIIILIELQISPCRSPKFFFCEFRKTELDFGPISR